MQPSKLDLDPSSTSASKEWKHWFKTFNNYLEVIAQTLPAGREVDKLKALINCVSCNVFEFIEDCETYEAAIAKLKNVYVKTPNEVFARHLLVTTKQQVEQSLDEYLLALQKLAKDCNFRAVSGDQYKQEMVRDAFINGILSPGIRQRLLENDRLILETAVQQARSLDLAQKNAEFYSQSRGINSDLAVAATSEPAQQKDPSEAFPCTKLETSSSVSKLCFYCGRLPHSRNVCPAKNALCYKCHKKGHFANVCKQRVLKSQSASVASPSVCAIHKTPDCLSRASLTAVLADTEVSALIDFGSSCSFVNEHTAHLLKLRIVPCRDNVSMASSALKGNVFGCCNVDLRINDCNYFDVKLKVLKNLCCDILLGQDFQAQHKQVVFRYEGNKDDLVVSYDSCALTAASADVPSLFSNLSPKCKPIAVKSRRFNNNDRKFIDEEIHRLHSEGIIRPSVSPWRAQVVVVKNAETNNRRMCIDYSQTINLFTELDAYPLPKIDTLINDLAKYTVFSTFDLRSAYHQIPIAEKDRIYTAFEASGKLWEFIRIPFGVTNGVPAFQREMDKLVQNEGLSDTFPYVDNITVGGRNQQEHDQNVKNLLDALQQRKWTLNDKKAFCRSPRSTFSVTMLVMALYNLIPSDYAL